MTILIIILFAVVLLASLYWLFMSSFSQLFGSFPYRVKTQKKIIALTFDDGPNEPYTSQILSYLDEKNVKATFFQVGKCIERYPGLSKKIVASGHVVGNHSVSHAFHKYFFSPTFKKEIVANQEIIERHINKRPALFRPPWLFRQPWLLHTVRALGLQVVSGEFCHASEIFQKFGHPTAEQIADHVVRIARPGSIIIFHDGFDSRGGDRHATATAVGLVIERLQEDGYQFVTINTLLGIPAYL